MAVRIMESAWITNGQTQVRRAPFLETQAALTASATSQQSAAFGANTGLITVQADEAVHVKIGNNPTATSADFKIGAGDTADFGVTPGDKLAVITG